MAKPKHYDPTQPISWTNIPPIPRGRPNGATRARYNEMLAQIEAEHGPKPKARRGRPVTRGEESRKEAKRRQYLALREATGRNTKLGREPGFTHSEETRAIIAEKSVRREVTGPDGVTCPSIHAASVHHNCHPNSVVYYCKMGAKQRESGVGKNQRDYRGWYIDMQTNRRARKVQTPRGVYASVSAAARAYGLSPAGMIQRIKLKMPGYEYAAEDAVVDQTAPPSMLD